GREGGRRVADGGPRGVRRPAPAGEIAAAGLPPPIASSLRTVLDELAASPFGAPSGQRLQELGLDAKALAAAARARLVLRLPGDVIPPARAARPAAALVAGPPPPLTAAEARRALGPTRRVVIRLLEHRDRAGVTRRLADDRRRMRDEPHG